MTDEDFERFIDAHESRFSKMTDADLDRLSADVDAHLDEVIDDLPFTEEDGMLVLHVPDLGEIMCAFIAERLMQLDAA